VRVLWTAYETLRRMTDAADIERVYVFVGGLFTVVERYAAARDAFSILEETTQSEEVRSDALAGLFIIAARDGTPEEFTERLQRVTQCSLAAETHVNVLIESARGYARFGDVAAAVAVLEEGQRFAEAHGLNRSVFEADAMVADLDRRLATAHGDTVAAAAVDPTIQHVEVELRQLAAATAV
jgi:hypothetical protein